jgi:hypothetical protein
VAGIFTQIRPVWIGDLEIRQKLKKINGWGIIFLFLSAKFFAAMSATAPEKFLFSYVEKKIVLDCFYIYTLQ